MDYCAFRHRTSPIVEALPSVVKSNGDCKFFSATLRSSDSSRNIRFPSSSGIKFSGSLHFGRRIRCIRKRNRTVLVAAASAASSNCEFTDLNTPLEPRTSAGTFLSDILQNQRHIFHVAVAEQLEVLAEDRDGAFDRMKHSLGSAESCLHRRIAEMKEHECQIAIEDVMYTLIVQKFAEIKVPMVPKLSRCFNNGTLEIWPLKDTELESIHSFEVLEMVMEHLDTIIGWSRKSNLPKNGRTTHIDRLQLGRFYAASIMYGYFLKSASLKHKLELNLALTNQDMPLVQRFRRPVPELQLHGLENLVVLDRETRSTSLCHGYVSHTPKRENLKCYIMGFDPETFQRCAKLKSKEAVNLIEKHTWALLGDENSDGFEPNEVISVSFSSLRRLLMEAIAFGTFLWDVEGYVNTVYKLKDN